MAETKSCKFDIEPKSQVDNPSWEGGKLTRTHYTKQFKGEIDGTSNLEAVMLKLEGAEGVMAYVGVERIACTLEGRKGTFILVHNAEAIGSQRQATWKILPGSGTGGLTGISGHGSITPGHDFNLTYELPPIEG